MIILKLGDTMQNIDLSLLNNIDLTLSNIETLLNRICIYNEYMFIMIFLILMYLFIGKILSYIKSIFNIFF